MSFRDRVRWNHGSRGPAMAAGAIFLTILVMFPHLPLPFFKASEQIAYDTARPEPAMPGADTDGDGLYDNIEKRIGTNPLVRDTDGDGLEDGPEYRYWNTRYDRESNENGTARWLTERYPREDRSLLLKRYLPTGDLDGDRLINIRDPDADGDRLLDGSELDTGTDPANPDTDGDGKRDDVDDDNTPSDDHSAPANYTNPDHFRPVSSNFTSDELGAPNFTRFRMDENHVLFWVYPADRPRYWRTAAYDTYANGSWVISSPGKMNYFGDYLPQEVDRPPEVAEDTYHIDFNNESTGFLPNALHTTRLYEASPPVPITLDRMGNFATGGVLNEYRFTSFAVPLSGQMLEAGQFSPDRVHSELTALPDGIPSRVKALAETVTGGASTPIGLIKAILTHLKSGYMYTPDLNEVPPGEDLVDRFLFSTRQGSSLEFASAFVVLARQNGIPCRLVSGYAIGDLVGGKRVVRAGHFHAWAEVLFSNLGWVQFETSVADVAEPNPVGTDGDPPDVGRIDVENNTITFNGTGPPTNETIQNVTMQNGSFSIKLEVRPQHIMKGQIFMVNGSLIFSAPMGAGASINVYMNTSDSVVGRGKCGPDGSFSIPCNADGLPVGEKRIGITASVLDRNIMRVAETSPLAQKKVWLYSNTTLEIVSKSTAVRGKMLSFGVRMRDAGGVASPWTELVDIYWNSSYLWTVEVTEEDDQRLDMDFPPGPYNLTAIYNGTFYLFPSNATRTIWVKAGEPRLDLYYWPESPAVGNDLVVKPTVYDEYNRPIKENVTVSMDGEPMATNMSGSTIIFRLDRTKIESGMHTLKVFYPGSDFYPEKTQEVQLRIRGTSVLSLQPEKVSLGTTRLLSGRLVGNLGEPIIGVTVTLNWNDTQGNNVTFRNRTLGEGDFYYKMSTARDTPPGGVLVSATYFEDEDYLGSSNTTFIQLTSPSHFNATMPGDLTRGAAFCVTGTLYDHLSRPILRARVTVQHGPEAPWGIGWTNETGGFEIASEVPSSEDTGPAVVELRYPGEGYQEAAVATFPVGIYTMCFINLSVPGKLEQGGGFDAVAVLVDDREAPLTRVNVTLSFAGLKTTRATDAYGRAVFPLRFPWLSTKEDLTVQYKGGNYTRPARASVRLSAEPVLFFRLLGVLAVAAVFAGAYYAYRRLGWGRSPEEVLIEMLDRSWISDRYRKTIFKVYTRMMGRMRSLGHPKREAWTVREYQHELERRLRLDMHHLALLTLIFEEARYSRHKLDGEVSQNAVRSYRKVVNSVAPPGQEHSEVPVETRNAI